MFTATSRTLPGWLRYALTTALVAAAFAARWVLFGPGPRYPFLTAFPVVALVGVAFDRGTGIYAALLTSALAVHYVLPPVAGFAVEPPIDLLALAVYLATAIFLAFVMEALHLALADLGRAREAAERQTAALAEANQRLAAAAEERATLLREAIHRARNDLQRLAATIVLQGSAATEPATKEALADAARRVLALARINARLEEHWHEDASVEVREWLEGLGEDLRNGAVGLRPVVLRVEAEPGPRLALGRAVALGLVVNELVGNALKYAFPCERAGIILVQLQRDGEDALVLTVEDDGEGFDPAAPPRGTGLGMQLARALAAQLGGRLDGPAAHSAKLAGAPEAAAGAGADWTLRMPLEG